VGSKTFHFALCIALILIKIHRLLFVEFLFKNKNNYIKLIESYREEIKISTNAGRLKNSYGNVYHDGARVIIRNIVECAKVRALGLIRGSVTTCQIKGS
jgi:hypothetical protein